MSFYEIAASTVAQVICGCNPMHGSGRVGIGLDAFGGPLDTRFTRDVAVATTKLGRREANDVVKRLLAKYEVSSRRCQFALPLGPSTGASSLH